jgi:hypothetical protein
MPVQSRRKTLIDQQASDISEQKPGFSEDFQSRLKEITGSGLDPASALDLIVLLISECPDAQKETMEQIKLMDKLINTAKGMIETKIKHVEAAALSARLDDMESVLDRTMAQYSNHKIETGDIDDPGGLDGESDE